MQIPNDTSPRDPYRLTGDILGGKYKLMEYAGGGGMGAVYRAVNTEQQMIVAVKILKPDIIARNPEYSELFEKEVMAARRLNHPHIVNVLDSGTDENITFMVMEWLEGETLEDATMRKTFPISRIVSIFDQICSAVAFAHEHSVIHLDIKPSNIVLTKGKQSEDFIKVIDFGLSRIISKESGTTVTKFRGTHQYCAPEQFGGKVSYRSDIYSLGATLYNLLTGVMPFGASYINAKFHPNLELPTIPSIARQCGLSYEIDIVLRRALQKNPALRQQSANQLFEEFEKAVLREVKVRQVNPTKKNVSASATIRSLIEPKRTTRRLGVLDDWNHDMLAQMDEKTRPQVNATSRTANDIAPITLRFAAGIIDLLVVGFASSPFAAIIELTGAKWEYTLVQTSMVSIVVVLMFLYLMALTALAGRTWGMSLFSLRTVDARTGMAPTTEQSVRRSIFYMLSFVTLGIGLLYALFDPEGRTVHDHLSGTLVLYDQD